ncbi:DASH family cryptochrome [Congregibacter litoralis]|uniref:Cryptochrome DASH n=1 Tax=Congregibacter litoralis KT71 TaxID=314285 RepID=A4A625_9GAMM|nr:DASH family cryptochrome [Congregibacter litoralis]EAQ98472.1 deoxyribodipyrimidine photo-lyase (single-stranded DNA-specific) [Congregibacter litoralis KT71]
MRAIYWFRNDLRLHDNPGLVEAAKADELLLLYLWPLQRAWCNTQGLGEQRERFITESLKALQDDLQPLGQSLLVLQGSPELVIPDLVRDYGVDAVHASQCAGSYETRAVRVLRERLHIPVTEHAGNTLFRRSDIKALCPELPRSFSPFRRKVEKNLEPLKPSRDLPQLPPPPAVTFHRIPDAAVKPPVGLPLRGGSSAGQRRLKQFLHSGAIRSYKETRNCLDPLEGSSTLSPWLALGSLSAREVAAAVHEHEAQEGANESTYWLVFELLWREYFFHRALQDGVSLFRHGGREGKVSRCTFEPRNFARWCAGDTNHPLVNALMHQLVATGWMSNRGRQIAASCLIHDFGIDWRYGAAFFEKHLIDYDVGSNYGNWQYIAGVGADPRGGRAFNIEKQTAQYDPDGVFIAKWDGERAAQPMYVTDAADWPINPTGS